MLKRPPDTLDAGTLPTETEARTEAALFTTVLELDDDFRTRVIQGYPSDPRWSLVIETLKKEADLEPESRTRLPYFIENELLYLHRGTETDGDPVLFLPRSLSQEIFRLVHDRQNHQGFDVAWAKLRGLSFYKGYRLLKDYIAHCPDCLATRVRRHRPYGALQPVLAPPIPFHTVTMDFAVGLPPVSGLDCVLTNQANQLVIDCARMTRAWETSRDHALTALEACREALENIEEGASKDAAKLLLQGIEGESPADHDEQ
ncbi:hypothetical protein N7528_007301 [Penicillium herquei]|nr:hypothetical protein N7528_007301 [Penicillium herquei]